MCFYSRVVLATRVFGEPNFIQCVCFDSKGEYISESVVYHTQCVCYAVRIESMVVS